MYGEQFMEFDDDQKYQRGKFIMNRDDLERTWQNNKDLSVIIYSRLAYLREKGKIPNPDYTFYEWHLESGGDISLVFEMPHKTEYAFVTADASLVLADFEDFEEIVENARFLKVDLDVYYSTEEFLKDWGLQELPDYIVSHERQVHYG